MVEQAEEAGQIQTILILFYLPAWMLTDAAARLLIVPLMMFLLR